MFVRNLQVGVHFQLYFMRDTTAFPPLCMTKLKSTVDIEISVIRGVRMSDARRLPSALDKIDIVV